MTPTLSYLREKFAEFNTLFFDSQLPVPQLRIGRSRTMLGNLRYKRRRKLFGRDEISDVTLSISAYYDLDEALLEDTIIHEMIHYYILYFRLKDTSSHGQLFREIMNRINTTYGRHITVSYRGHSNPVAEKDEKSGKWLLVIVCTMSDGSETITVPVQSRTLAIMRQLPEYYAVRSMRLYSSQHPLFASLPRSRTPKLYRVPVADLATALSQARHLSEYDYTTKPK